MERASDIIAQISCNSAARASGVRVVIPTLHKSGIVGLVRMYTHAGLFNNIEAGSDIELDLADASDKAFVDAILDGFDDLINNHPQHCFRILNGRQIVDLMKQGILEDERNPKTQTAFGSGKQGNTTSKPRINLPFKGSPNKTKKKKPKLTATAPASGAPISPPIYGQLVWSKPRLPRSDLQLNPGHAPGVLRLTQAKYKINGTVIDQTTYFRNQVFSLVNWTYNPTAQKDEAVVATSLIIAGVHVGDFDMPLSHKPAWAAGQGSAIPNVACLLQRDANDRKRHALQNCCKNQKRRTRRFAHFS
ncbi:hypothetical protein SAMN05444414_11361 [Roseovarius marisflavi]|uniref:Uncharacterized protein n=2 Tax=Roseovarius marisflavi TaxID=1054996 RepID=A0A1M7AF09_9RHOB|nr:hypothetical protein SAMN05444414_11361 [Roseovarius marisflavi]